MGTTELTELNVVVTGFSPWGSYAPLPNIPINTSWQIASSLPRVIFRRDKPNIRVLTLPTPIKTSWQTARETVPVLWQGKKADYGIYVGPDSPPTFTIHAMVHLGMDDEDNAPFTFEKRAFKAAYKDHDVDGKTPTTDDLNGGGLWDKCPAELDTELDVEGVREQVKAEHANMRTLTDPGRYLCGYLYYSSLAVLEASGARKRVLFIHVPPKHESGDVEMGVEVVTRAIEAIADHLKTGL